MKKCCECTLFENDEKRMINFMERLEGTFKALNEAESNDDFGLAIYENADNLAEMIGIYNFGEEPSEARLHYTNGYADGVRDCIRNLVKNENHKVLNITLPAKHDKQTVTLKGVISDDTGTEIIFE